MRKPCNSRIMPFCAAALWIVFGAQVIFPARTYWTSPAGGNTKWSNDANWNAGRAPQTGDTAVFGIKGKRLAACELDVDAAVADIFFRPAYTPRFDFGGHFLSVTGDTCDLRSGGDIGDGGGRGGILFEPAGTLTFFPGSQAVVPTIAVRCLPGGVVVCRESGFRADTISFLSGTLRCGSGLLHQAGVVQSSGGMLDLDSSTLAVSGAIVNFAGITSFLSATGTLVFRGASPQRIVVPPDSVRIHCMIQDGGGGTTISKTAGTGLYADTVAIRAGALVLDDSVSLTITALQSLHGGLVIPVSARLTLHGSSDFSGLDSLNAAGMIACAGTQSCVTLTPKPGIQLSRLDITAGRLQLAGNGLSADSVRCAAACTLSLGVRLVHAVRAVSLEQGAVVNFESSVLRFGGNRLDLSGCGAVLPGTGCIEFNAASPQVFFPAAGKTCPSIFQNGTGGTTLSGCDLLAGSLAIGAGTFNLNGYSVVIDTLRGNPAGAGDTLKTGLSPQSEINARGAIFLDQLAVSGDVRLHLSGVKQDVRFPANYHIVKLLQSSSASAALSAPAGSKLSIDTLSICTGALDLGSGLWGPFSVNVHSFSATGGGLVFGGSTMRFSGDTMDLSHCLVPSQQQDGGIEFCGAKQQVFIPAQAAVYPAIIATGPGPTIVSGSGFSCARLSVASGGSLLLGTALNHSVSSKMQVLGTLDFGTSTLSVAADSVDLSGAASLVPGNGTLSFSGAFGTQFFVPKAGALHPNLIKTHGGTVVLGAPCLAKKLWIADGTFDCGNYKCELTGFSAVGGSLAVGSDSLIVSGNALFAGLTAISTASAPVVVRTSPASPVSVFSTGDREIGNLVLLAAGAGGPARILAAAGTHRAGLCTFAWSRSQDSAVFDFRQNNASLSVSDSAAVLIRGTGIDKGRIYMGSGIWTFTGSFALTNYARDGSKIVFAADTGTQILSAPIALGDVVHSGAGRLEMISNVNCRSFTQTAGILDFNGCAVSSEGDISVTNGSDSSIAPSLRGWKMETLGSAALSGRIRNYLTIASGAQCTLSAAVSLKARYAVLKNCRALLQKGTASKCFDSLGNTNWLFSNRPAPPTGLYVRRGNGVVSLAWNRSPAADAMRFFVYAGTGTAALSKRDSTDSSQDTVRTIANLTNGHPYYFSVTVLDSAGSESDFAGQLSAVPDSGLLEMSAGRVSFGRVAVGSTADTAISLFNGCSDTVVISSVKVRSAAFACSLTSLRIPPRQSVSDTLTFRPLRQGPDSAIIVILSNALSSPDTVRVSGTGTAPRFCALPDSVLFDVPGPTAILTHTIMIRNTGNDTLRISQVTRLVTADYVSDSLFMLSQIRDLAPGDSCIDTLRFFPGKAGNYSARFLLKSNCISSPDTLFVSGKCGAIATAQSPTSTVPKDFSFQEASVIGRTVVFRYALPVSSRVTLDIYNAIGRFLERPLESLVGAHEYQFSWDGSHLSRGIYFCRFKAADSDDADPKFMRTIRIVFSK
jgi:Abnormal spindle-like microcephaly-assoc'd, ASPM-SPD-2-Hydin